MSRSIQSLVLSLLLIVPACAGPSRREVAASTSPAPAWSLQGWRIIGCCCTAPCACRINKKPSYCHGCDHTDVVHVERGQLGGVRMDGVQWTVVGRGFGEGLDANWAYVYVDDDASAEQVAALGSWLGAGVAAWGAKAPYLAGDFRGLREVPMTTRVSSDRREYAVSIPGILEFQTRAIVNPGQREPVVSTGIMDAFGDRFVHSDALLHTYADATLGASWDLTGRQSNQADFAVDAARVAQGGIGWGCWTAHSDFGDGAPYGEQQESCHEQGTP
jgi:hypothetical protein